ncbi:MAG: hypothetical protein ACAF41_28185 [Leptolyngbya sp. BL-A-14]
MKNMLRNTVSLGAMVAAAIGTISLFAATPANAIVIPAQRIQFAPGRDSETLNGYLGSRNMGSYVFNARAEQQAYISVNTPSVQPVVLTVYGADSALLVNGIMSGFSAWNGRLPRSEDYFVRVTNEAGVPTPYHLNVTILPSTAYHRPPFVNF